LLAAGAWLGFSGCATPGPLHLYSLPPGSKNIHDQGNGQTAEVPSFLEAGDRLTGFAYDPFTDHFFLRLAPGNAIRVVDRPARKIKREFTIDGIPAEGAGGDLALRPRDGHLFLLHPREALVLETTRLGKFLRSIPLGDTAGLPLGIAYDAGENRLLVLAPDRHRITVHAVDDGRKIRDLALDRAVGPSLAFDAEKREFHAPLADSPGHVGVFDAYGKFLRQAAAPGNFVDVGQRSFVRVF
jgi:uncharacterized protein YjiK